MKHLGSGCVIFQQLFKVSVPAPAKCKKQWDLLSGLLVLGFLGGCLRTVFSQSFVTIIHSKIYTIYSNPAHTWQWHTYICRHIYVHVHYTHEKLKFHRTVIIYAKCNILTRF